MRQWVVPGGPKYGAETQQKDPGAAEHQTRYCPATPAWGQGGGMGLSYTYEAEAEKQPGRREVASSPCLGHLLFLLGSP